MLPNIAIIGRPNVGKSTLFNRLVGKKLALVDDTPGVTRDRREGAANLLGLQFNVVDTAGYENEDAKSLPGRMRKQTEMAVAGAELAIFVIDGRAGLTPLDEEIARWLRSAKTPVILLVNKAEGKAAESGILESYALGFGDPIPFSAEHGDGMADLFQAIQPYVENFKAAASEEPNDASAPLKLAIVGRPNAGTSTLINKMLDEDRHDDALTEAEKLDGIEPDRQVRLIDTAGMRKRAKVNDKLEKLAVADARHAVDFAEVVVLLLDATKGLEAQDLRIADHAIQEGRCVVIGINKWDVAEGPSKLFNGIRAALNDGLAQVRDVPLIAVSAFTGKGIDQLIKAAFEVRRIWSQRVSTGKLNRWFEDAITENPPPAPGGKRIKLRYITQAKTRPPSFVIFGTRVDDLPESYRRYLINGIRRELGFGGVPVRLIIRAPKNPYHEKE